MLTPPHRFSGGPPAHTARDRSWSSATGLPVTPPRRWVPGSVLGPGMGLRAERQRYAAAHWPPAQRLPPSAPGPLSGAAGSGPPLLRGFGPPPEASPLRRGPPAPGSAGLGLTPPSRRPSLRRRPGPPLASLRPPGGSDGSGTRSSGRPWAAPGKPPAHPTRHGGLPPGPSAPEPRRVPPGRPRPRPALPRPSLSWSPGRADGLRSSRLGPGAALAGRFLRPPAPGVGGRYSRGMQRGSRQVQAGELLAAVHRRRRQLASPLREIRAGGGEGGAAPGGLIRAGIGNRRKSCDFRFIPL